MCLCKKNVRDLKKKIYNKTASSDIFQMLKFWNVSRHLVNK